MDRVHGLRTCSSTAQLQFHLHSSGYNRDNTKTTVMGYSPIHHCQGPNVSRKGSSEFTSNTAGHVAEHVVELKLEECKYTVNLYTMSCLLLYRHTITHQSFLDISPVPVNEPDPNNPLLPLMY
ncbi:unnamed protein product [Pleuronectes platessa]|uniref:Uncharacterized protein n=1 Tax=Pleuronectes platessa TaxID=8262 RepID=A0A9N7YC78_PLEPL|nr:unnamed protein product [Pleuronectes platessa]